LPLLSERFEIELFSDSLSVVSKSLPMHHYLTAYRRHGEKPFDLFFYQLEDGTQCRFARMHMGLMPGVLWVHDLFLQDHGPEGLFTSPWERTLSQFRDLGIAFYDRANAPHQLWPQAYREVSLAPVLLFSSSWAMGEFTNFISERIEPYPGGQRVEYVPVPVAVNNGSRSPDTSVALQLANVGTPNTEDRGYKILPALRDVQSECHMTWLVDSSEESRARALVEEFSVEDRVTLVVGRSVERWSEIVQRSDVALHMHRSPFGHLAPYLQISLAAGTPIVVSDAAEGSQLPRDCVFPVVPGMFESAELRELFQALNRTPLDGVARRGREFILSHSDVKVVAHRLASVLEESSEGIKRCMDRWELLQRRASEALIAEVVGLAGKAPDGFEAEQIVLPAARELGWLS
jgi:glycosyltransferase involved in cell wall biosynthesis